MKQRTSTTNAKPRGDVLVELIYELLDAHYDTTQLATGQHLDEASRWHAHLDYLRGLQRTARELLAHASTEGQP